jgi:hypothetical protein
LPAGALNISGAGVVQFADNVTTGTPLGTSNVVLTSLSITGTGALDIGNNHLLIDYTAGNDPIASIAAWIAQGYAAGAWDGPGIDSSAPMVLNGFSYGIGYADSADPGNPAGLATDQIEIAYTLLGDANLNGIVDSNDYGIVHGNFNNGVGLSWDQGDFTYDGVENGIDMTLLAANFGQASQAAGVLSSGPAALVPEPGMVAILLPISFGLLLNRRRRAL